MPLSKAAFYTGEVLGSFFRGSVLLRISGINSSSREIRDSRSVTRLNRLNCNARHVAYDSASPVLVPTLFDIILFLLFILDRLQISRKPPLPGSGHLKHLL